MVKFKKDCTAQQLDYALAIIMSMQSSLSDFKDMNLTMAKGSDKALKVTRDLKDLEFTLYCEIKRREM